MVACHFHTRLFRRTNRSRFFLHPRHRWRHQRSIRESKTARVAAKIAVAVKIFAAVLLVRHLAFQLAATLVCRLPTLPSAA
jgi:hypothetical protein